MDINKEMTLAIVRASECIVNTAERQTDSLESIAKDLRTIREFLIETTIRDLDKKSKELRKESREANEKKQASKKKGSK
jgi:hypothetical protein